MVKVKFSRDEYINLIFDLINAFKIVKTPYETALLLQDLLTADEIKHLARRLRIAKLLLSGTNHRDIASELNCSLATVTKVNMWLRQGGQGIKKVISKLPQKYDIPKNLPPIPIEFQLPQVLLTTAQYLVSKNQGKPAEELLGNIEKKKIVDTQLQEILDEEFWGRKLSR